MQFFPYIFVPERARLAQLFRMAKADPLYAEILSDLRAHGYEIRVRYFAQPASYTPVMVRPEATDYPPAQFTFSSRFGFAVNAHQFLHELYHFYQDVKGRFHPGMSAADYLACEAEAEVEALAASLRLKEQGDDVAWRGALRSPDWAGLAKAYAKNPDKQAMIAAWYQLPVKKYYERRARKFIQAMPEGYVSAVYRDTLN